MKVAGSGATPVKSLGASGSRKSTFWATASWAIGSLASSAPTARLTGRTATGLLGLQAGLGEAASRSSRVILGLGLRARADRGGRGRGSTLAPLGRHFDAVPILVVTDGAVGTLGEDRERAPDVVVEGVHGLAERNWVGRRLRLGTVELSVRERCERCVTDHDRRTRSGIRPDGPAADQFGLRGTMGVYCGVAVPGGASRGRSGRAHLRADRYDRPNLDPEATNWLRSESRTAGFAAALRHGRDGRGRQADQASPRLGAPALAGDSRVRGDRDGHIQNDPDRVLHPLRKNAAGEFERVGWDEALDEIGSALEAGSSRSMAGTPSATTWGIRRRSRTRTRSGPRGSSTPSARRTSTASSQDVSNRFAASAFLYGSPYIVPIPDLARTDFLPDLVGANPLVSHSSVMSAPASRSSCAITERGSRALWWSIRAALETARAFGHVSVHPDSDAFLLLSMLEAIFSDGLEDSAAIERQTRGVVALRAQRSSTPPSKAEIQTGVEARECGLARDLARAERAAVYGRTRSCLGRNATVVAFLLDAQPGDRQPRP